MNKPSKVAIVGADWPLYEKYCPNFTGMQDGLRTLDIEHQLFSCRPVLDDAALIEYKPDLIVYGLIDMVKAHDLRMRIRRALPDTRIVLWYGDLRGPETGGQIRANLSEIDMMFVSNDAQQEYYKKVWKVPECHFLPLGSSVWNPPVKKKFDFDFVFIGGLITGAGFLERARMMHNFKNQGLRIIDGPMWKPKLRAKVMKEMPSIYRSAKVVLDCSHFTHIQGYTSNRYWIITAAGGFALTKRWPGCEQFYPEGTRIYFDSFEEALYYRDYFINNPEKRERIRKAGHDHAHNHTYDKRFVTMFEKLYGQDCQNRLQRGSSAPRTQEQSITPPELSKAPQRTPHASS